MITGFNTNVQHRDLLFHVQTEDSGRAHPHLISHVYCGGTIIASEKSDYSERIDAEDLDRQVRVLMEAQHKSMISRLEQGEFDGVIAERLPGKVPPSLAQTAPVTEPPALVEVLEPAPPASALAAAPAAAPEANRSFGDGVVSQKPLDEVILEYLIEKARSSRTKG
jgi:hypothetical protein